MQTLRETFIKNLKHFRKVKNFSQEKLSKEINMGMTYINQIENKGTWPQPEIVDKIATALDIKTSELFLEEGCNANLVLKDKKQFIDELSTKIKTEIFDDIQKGIEKAICEGLK